MVVGFTVLRPRTALQNQAPLSLPPGGAGPSLPLPSLRNFGDLRVGEARLPSSRQRFSFSCAGYVATFPVPLVLVSRCGSRASRRVSRPGIRIGASKDFGAKKSAPLSRGERPEQTLLRLLLGVRSASCGDSDQACTEQQES